MFVMMREELGFVRRHVDVDGAIALAAFAREAQVERIVYGLRLPTVGDRSAPRAAVEHLVQEPSTPSGRMFLVAGHHVGRTHDAAAFTPTFADADTTEHGLGEASSVGRVREVRALDVVVIVAPDAEVLVECVGLDDLAGIHPVVGVEDRLHPFEGTHDLGPEHPDQELAARLAVAVLARKRPAVRRDQIGSPFQERAELCDAGRGEQVERDAAVHATLAEVAVQRGLRVSVFVEQ